MYREGRQFTELRKVLEQDLHGPKANGRLWPGLPEALCAATSVPERLSRSSGVRSAAKSVASRPEEAGEVSCATTETAPLTVLQGPVPPFTVIPVLGLAERRVRHRVPVAAVGLVVVWRVCVRQGRG